MLKEDVAAVSLGQGISHLLSSLSVCSEHTVGNLKEIGGKGSFSCSHPALGFTASSPVPELGEALHIQLKTSPSRKGEWAGRTAPGGLRMQKMVDSSCGPIPDVHSSQAVLVFQ